MPLLQIVAVNLVLALGFPTEPEEDTADESVSEESDSEQAQNPTPQAEQKVAPKDEKAPPKEQRVAPKEERVPPKAASTEVTPAPRENRESPRDNAASREETPPAAHSAAASKVREAESDTTVTAAQEIALGGGLTLKVNGYFRAPLRLTVSKREGELAPGDEDKDYRLPRLIDSDYYKSNFGYTRINESDWAELYFTLGTERYSATIGLMTTNFSDAAFSPDTPSPAGQKGISQAYITTLFDPAPFGQRIDLALKVGSFWESFGYQPKYDTYIFGRTHLMGEQFTAATSFGDFSLGIKQGLGVHLADTAMEGLSVAHYYRLTTGWAKQVELGLNYLNAFSQDRVKGAGTDSDMTIKGFDVGAGSELFGHLYLGFSWLTIKDPRSLGAAIEVMHTFKGAALRNAYLGETATEGELFSVGFQYDYEFDQLLRKFDIWPFPEGSNLVGSVFLLSMKTTSDAEPPGPNERSIWTGYDDRHYLKYGAELEWRPLSWVGTGIRYDRVYFDASDESTSFIALSPRLVFYPALLGDTRVYLQYSRYGYGTNVKPQPADLTRYGEELDRNVFKIQAQATF